MIRYKYEFVPSITTTETDVDGNEVIATEEAYVTKTHKQTYRHTDTLEKDLSDNKPVHIIKRNYVDALVGLLNKHTIDIEDQWYQKYQNLETVINREQKLVSEILVQKAKLEVTEETITSTETIEDDTYTEGVPNLVEKEVSVDNPEYRRITDLISIYETELNILKDNEVTVINPNGDDDTYVATGEIYKVTEILVEFEKINPWLSNYRGIANSATRPEVVTTAVISDDVLKRLVAYERDRKVRNSEDSIADIAKMTSLLFSVVTEIYETIPTEALDKIEPRRRTTIEYAMEKFKTIDTRADTQLLEEGVGLIDKLFSREVNINNLVSDIMKKD